MTDLDCGGLGVGGVRKHHGWRGSLVLRLHRGPIQLQLREYLKSIPSTTTFPWRKCEGAERVKNFAARVAAGASRVGDSFSRTRLVLDGGRFCGQRQHLVLLLVVLLYSDQKLVVFDASDHAPMFTWF